VCVFVCIYIFKHISGMACCRDASQPWKKRPTYVSQILLNNSPDSILVACDLRPASSMCCVRKQMRGTVLFLNSWERDCVPARPRLRLSALVREAAKRHLCGLFGSPFCNSPFPSGFHLRMSAWAGRDRARSAAPGDDVTRALNSYMWNE